MRCCWCCYDQKNIPEDFRLFSSRYTHAILAFVPPQVKKATKSMVGVIISAVCDHIKKIQGLEKFQEIIKPDPPRSSGGQSVDRLDVEAYIGWYCKDIQGFFYQHMKEKKQKTPKKNLKSKLN